MLGYFKYKANFMNEVGRHSIILRQHFPIINQI